MEINRVTEKTEKGYTYKIPCPDGLGFLVFDEYPIQKFGKLEDIEEELGIDLTLLPTLLKIKKGDKIYAIDGMNLIKAEVTGNALINGKLMVFSHYGYNGITHTPVCYYSEYGKKWALTKDELLW